MANTISAETMSLPSVLTTTQLAGVLHVSHNTAHRLVRDGKIKSYMVGNRYRISRAAVVKYMKSQHEREDDDLDIKELAERLGVCEHTAYNLIRSGEIQSYRVGNYYRIPRKAVEKYISEGSKSGVVPQNDTDLRVKDLPPLLGVSYKTAYRRVQEGKIRSVRVGSSYRIPKDAVDEYLHGLQVPAPSIPEDGDFTVKDLAAILNVSYQVALNRVRAGKIRSVQVNGRYQIPREAVDEYLNHNPAEPIPQEQDLNLKELEKLLNISHASAYNLVFRKRIRSYRVKNQYRIPRAAVDEYLQSLPPPIDDDCINVDDVAEILGISRHRAYKLVWAGIIPSHRIGNRYRIDKNAPAEYLAKQESLTEGPQRP